MNDYNSLMIVQLKEIDAQIASAIKPDKIKTLGQRRREIVRRCESPKAAAKAHSDYHDKLREQDVTRARLKRAVAAVASQTDAVSNLKFELASALAKHTEAVVAGTMTSAQALFKEVGRIKSQLATNEDVLKSLSAQVVETQARGTALVTEVRESRRILHFRDFEHADLAWKEASYPLIAVAARLVAARALAGHGKDLEVLVEVTSAEVESAEAQLLATLLPAPIEAAPVIDPFGEPPNG